MELIDKAAILAYLNEKMEWYAKEPVFFGTEMATVEQIIAKIESGTFDIKEPDTKPLGGKEEI